MSTDRDTRLFKLIRDMLGRGLTQAEVDATNEALYDDLTEAPERRTSAEGIALIHSFESCRLKAYPDPGSKDGKPVTIGWGSTTDESGKPILLGTVWTQARADARFRLDLAKFEQAVSAFLGNAPTTQNQFDAMVSFHYNTGAIAKSTLGRLHKACNYDGARAEFAKWNKNDGKVLNGLTRRRAEEASLYGRA